MDAKQIIDLYYCRSEKAILETSKKYGNYCFSVAFHILHNNEDSEECVNDTYLRAWNSIPPECPANLSVYLGKITRNLALNIFEKNNAKKRGGSQVPLALDELSTCIPDYNSLERTVDNHTLTVILNSFLATLPADKRQIFMCRYWNLCSIKEIATMYHMSESKVKMVLFRTRISLKAHLEKEGINI